MKRFYAEASVVVAADGWAVQLDGQPVKTPARGGLTLPNVALADAVAGEWRDQGETIDPATMPMTGFANAAIDQIAPHQARFAAGIAEYGQSDLLCYRAEAPATLVERQAATWDPLLAWARARYDMTFHVTQGIVHVAQPSETLARLGAGVAAFDPFVLAGLSTLVTITGSLVCGLALVEGGHDPDDIWRAAELDEIWQAERWGEDAQAAAISAARHADFLAAHMFCKLALG